MTMEPKGKCSVPMWRDGLPAGFCDEPAYGERPKCKMYRDGDGQLHRTDGRYEGYVPGLACPNHGGPDAPETPSQIDDVVSLARAIGELCTVVDGLRARLEKVEKATLQKTDD